MSVKASSWVWHDSPRSIETRDHSVKIEGTELIVLLALADIADDHGNCIFGDPDDRKQEALAAKARVSVSTFRRTIRALESVGIVATTRLGMLNQYRINIDWKPDAAEVELSTTGQDDRSDSEVPPVMGDRYHRSAVTGQGNVIRKETISRPTRLTTEQPQGDDDQSPRPSPARVPHHLRAVDWPAVLRDVSPIFSGMAPDDLNAISSAILARATARVLDPTAFVTRALLNDPFEWQRFAFDHDTARAARGGNPF
ncbi:MAG: helix-turn-helix domain-containing protein [Rhodoglobus sp.]